MSLSASCRTTPGHLRSPRRGATVPSEPAGRGVGVEWGTLVATLGGAVIAISGTVLADRLRTRQEVDRGLGARRREAYIDFIAAAGAAHTQLRGLAQGPDAATDLESASRAALTDARLYEVRERLFIEASATVAGAGQAMFEQLRALRSAVAAGAPVSSPAFHDAYHPYIASVWAYRVAVRDELEGQSLSPAVFGWHAWDGKERCPCATQTWRARADPCPQGWHTATTTRVGRGRDLQGGWCAQGQVLLFLRVQGGSCSGRHRRAVGRPAAGMDRHPEQRHRTTAPAAAAVRGDGGRQRAGRQSCGTARALGARAPQEALAGS